MAKNFVSKHVKNLLFSNLFTEPTTDLREECQEVQGRARGETRRTREP